LATTSIIRNSAPIVLARCPKVSKIVTIIQLAAI
jgi:hypothetical protein